MDSSRSFTTWLIKAGIAVAVLAVFVLAVAVAVSRASAGDDENKIVVQLQETILIERGTDVFKPKTEPRDSIERTWTVTNTSERNTYCLITWANWIVTDKREVRLNITTFDGAVAISGLIWMSPGTKKQIVVRVTIDEATPWIDPGTWLEVTFVPPTRTSCPPPGKG